ncbi:MAG: PPC domain-containing protein [Armatimonadota bacterium]
MMRYLQYSVLALMLACTAAWCAPGERDPYISYAYPAGGQQGVTVQVLAAGQRLRGANGAVVSGGGVQVKVLNFVGPMGPLNKLQQDELTRRVREILAKRFPGRMPEKKAQPAPEKPVTLPDLPDLQNLDAKTAPQLRDLLDKYCNPNKRPKPPMAEEVTLAVTIDPAAAPGDRELRLRTPAGLSNPIVFQVGSAPEQREPEKSEPPLAPIVAPAVLNGQILPGQVDGFPLQLRAGQRLVAAAQARTLVPYLADAVPGWFQAVLTLYDADGKEVAFNDDSGFHPDPVLTYQVPKDGVYRLEIRDAIYRGRQDFVYRIEVGGEPPAAAAPALDDLLPGGTELSRGKETEPNDDAKATKPLALPRVVSGCIDTPGDVDLFQFAGRAGEEVVVEVYARRLGSPADALVRLLDANGRVVAWNDDAEDKGMGLLTHHADPYLSVKLPANGAYFVQVSEAQRHGGAGYRYAVRIGPRQPDFALRVTPSSVNVPPGGAAQITVYALRKDGWDGDIEVTLKGAPEGYTLSGGRIPAGRESVRMTLSAPLERRRASFAPLTFSLEGRAHIGGTTVTRPVVPADRMMQAFAYYHLVPAQQLLVTLTRAARFTPSFSLATAVPVRLPSGGRAEVACSIRPMPNLPLTFQLIDPPPGVTLEKATTGPDGVTLTLRADDKHAGCADNIIVEIFAEIEVPRPVGTKKKQRVSAGVLPAIPFTIVKP